MADIQNSLPQLIEQLEGFAHIFRYKVIYAKSVLILINIESHKVVLPPLIEIIYLDIKNSPKVSAMVNHNYLIVLKQLKKIKAFTILSPGQNCNY